ncbi:MAG: hypothetical protein EKK47_07185 [Burkholderiales bacterium]|jgi:hypothetical protein|nr:MAG: hypothetical protein EKK47_07185 [Burkholderiales bacterium]
MNLTRLLQPRVVWADQLDFIGPRVRTSVMAWAVLALGLAAVVHAVEAMDASQQALVEAQQTYKRLQRGSRQAEVRTKVEFAAKQKQQDAVPVLDQGGWRHAAQVAQWLGFGWRDVLERVDQAADGEHAVLMQFNLDLSTLASGPDVAPELKLQAAVRDDVNALQWMSAMGPKASLRTRDRLNTPFTTRFGDYTSRVDVVLAGGQP